MLLLINVFSVWSLGAMNEELKPETTQDYALEINDSQESIKEALKQWFENKKDNPKTKNLKKCKAEMNKLFSRFLNPVCGADLHKLGIRIFECQDPNCALLRSEKNAIRGVFEKAVISQLADHLKQRNREKKNKIGWASVGAGGLLQEYLVLRQLLKAGNKEHLKLFCFEPLPYGVGDLGLYSLSEAQEVPVFTEASQCVNWVVNKFRSESKVSDYCKELLQKEFGSGSIDIVCNEMVTGFKDEAIDLLTAFDAGGPNQPSAKAYVDFIDYADERLEINPFTEVLFVADWDDVLGIKIMTMVSATNGPRVKMLKQAGFKLETAAGGTYKFSPSLEEGGLACKIAVKNAIYATFIKTDKELEKALMVAGFIK